MAESGAASSATAITGGINFGSDYEVNPWLIGLGIVALAFFGWLVTRK